MNRAVPLTLFVAAAAFAQAPQPWQTAAAEALQKKEYATCARVASAAMKTEPRQAVSPAIIAARCQGGLGDTAKARRYLSIALQRGYRNCALLRKDALLKPTEDDLARCQANEDRYYNTANAEVFAAFLADQADRAGDIAGPADVMRRDEQRRHIVRLAIDHHTLKTSDDYYHAAMVMQHGSVAGDFALARVLAKRAILLDPSNAGARWLYAAATDRWLLRTGHPQIYGTQYKLADGKWVLEPLDRSAVTDAERVRFGVRVP